MKLLVSPIVEYRLLGLGQLTAGGAFAVVALTVDDAGAALLGWLLSALLFGALMYVLAYRRHARRALERPAPAQTDERERITTTLRRAAWFTLPMLPVLIVVAILVGSPEFGGIAAGNGVAILLISRSLRRWEREHGRRLLRDPRRRWSDGRRGVMGARDFYVEA